MTKIEKYIKACDENKQDKLFEVYEFILSNVPKETTQDIKWGMPTFVLNGNLIHFAVGKNHIGLYPGPSGVEYMKEELDQRGIKYSKGAIQLPLDKPLEKKLVLKLLKFRINENQSS